LMSSSFTGLIIAVMSFIEVFRSLAIDGAG
jgi:hypothetical protein